MNWTIILYARQLTGFVIQEQTEINMKWYKILVTKSIFFCYNQ